MERLLEHSKGTESKEIFRQIPNTIVNRKSSHRTMLSENHVYKDNVLISQSSLTVSVPLQTPHKPHEYELHGENLYKFGECEKAFIYPECFLKHKDSGTRQRSFELNQPEEIFKSNDYISNTCE